MKYAIFTALAFIGTLVITCNTGLLRTAADWYFAEPKPIARPEDSFGRP
jgi:hypothetical protein